MPFVDDLTKRKAGIDSPAKAPRASAPGGETEAPARKGSGVSGPDTPQPRVGGGGASGVGPEIPSTDSTRAPSDRSGQPKPAMRDKIAKATPALEKEETGTEAGGVGASKDALRKEGLELQDRLAVLHKTQQKLGKLELKGAQQKQLDDLVAEIHATEKAAKALVTSAEKENLTSDQIGELSSQIGGMKITVDDLSQRADQFISQ